VKLSRASLCAVQVLVHLAQDGVAAPVPAHDMARAQGASDLFMPKVLKPLVSAGILRSLRGSNGGYRLARRLRDVTLLEVVEAVDGPIRGGALPGYDHADAALTGKLDGIFAAAAGALRGQLGCVKLAHLVGGWGKGAG
jgi:Rrf2 family protein